ncbi:MAG: C1 family peptidase [Ferruginibacter sp.]
MKKIVTIVFLTVFVSGTVFSQPGKKGQIKEDGFVVEKNNTATAVKDQARTGTCWSFSTTSLIESQFLKANKTDIDLSEMFTVYNMYIEKAKNYIHRQGKAQFGEGGLGHDVIRSIATYGAMPETVFSGLHPGEKSFNHSKLVIILKEYLDNTLKSTPIPSTWLDDYKKLLNEHLGTPPSEFEVSNKKYTPRTFATEVLKFKADDYVDLTSFTDHPFYTSYILEVPDNFSNGSYYNIPMTEMLQLVKSSISKGYTIMWDADVSNSGFAANNGLGLFVKRADHETNTSITADTDELEWTVSLRQQSYENLTTQDDHLMHITGIEKSKKGKTFFIVKNSWGVSGPYEGYVNVSEAYFAMNTVSLVVPKEAIDKTLLLKLGIR